MRHVIKYSFRENIFGKQILQVLVPEKQMSGHDVYTIHVWHDATRQEADEFNCKINILNAKSGN